MEERQVTKTITVTEFQCACGKWFERYARFSRRYPNEYGSFGVMMTGDYITDPSDCPECHDKVEEKRLEKYREWAKNPHFGAN